MVHQAHRAIRPRRACGRHPRWPVGGEVISVLAAAVHAQLPVTVLRTMTYAYPTFHRAIPYALDDLASR